MAATWLGDLENQALINEMTIPPQTITTTVNGGSVDMQLEDGPISAILLIGTVTGTTGTLAVKLQESTDGTTYSDITGATFATVTTTPTNAQSQSIITIGKGGTTVRNPRTLRYMRAVATTGGTSPSFPCAVQLLAQKKILGGAGAQTN